MEGGTAIAHVRSREWAAAYRSCHPDAARRAVGYGIIDHSVQTQARVFALAERLRVEGVEGDGVPLFEVLAAADRLVSAAMWLVVHETYARDVFLDGRDLPPESFRPPRGAHGRRAQQGARVRRLHGCQRHQRPHARLDHGPGPHRRSDRLGQPAPPERHRRACGPVHALGGGPYALRP
jgi:hypothetical protein